MKLDLLMNTATQRIIEWLLDWKSSPRLLSHIEKECKMSTAIEIELQCLTAIRFRNRVTAMLSFGRWIASTEAQLCKQVMQALNVKETDKTACSVARNRVALMHAPRLPRVDVVACIRASSCLAFVSEDGKAIQGSEDATPESNWSCNVD